MGQAEVESEHGTSLSFYDKLLPNLVCPKIDVGTLTQISTGRLTQMHLLIQAQTLIKKNTIYQNIDRELHDLSSYQPNVFYNVPRKKEEQNKNLEFEWQGSRDEFVSSFDRDLSINNLRFLCIFYDCGPNVFSLATNFIDRLLGQTKVHLKFLSIFVVSCFYIAISFDESCFVRINPHDLLRLTHCETTLIIFSETTKHIMNHLFTTAEKKIVVTPLSFIRLFYDVFALQNDILEDASLKAFTVNRLEILLSRFQFTKFRYDILALSLLNYILQGLVRLDFSATLSIIIELQYYCQMNLYEYRECFALVVECLCQYHNQKTKTPTQKISLVLSRRVLQKMRPSTLVDLKLETVVEEDDKMDENGVDDVIISKDSYFSYTTMSPEDESSSEEEEEEEEQEEEEDMGNNRHGDDFQMYDEKYFEMLSSAIMHSDANNNQVIM